MLNHLSIKNVAVIDKLDVSINSGVSVLTGETGAGKSIIIDSINMILGDRANKELVRFGEEKAVVQAVFEAGPSVIKKLEENDIDVEDNQIIINRRVTKDGKSVAKINGTVVTLGLLREISDCLINIHGQHDNQALLTPQKHINFLDDYAADAELLEKYRSLYSKMRKTEKALAGLEMDEKEKMQRIDLLEYQIKEIESAKLTIGEDDDLKEQREIVANAEKIKVALNEAYENVYENTDAPSAYDSLSVAVNALAEISELNPTVKAVYDTLSEAVYTLEDAAHELKEFGDTVDFDENALNEIEERLDLISKLKRKYGNTIETVLKFLENGKTELENIKLSDEKTAELQQELSEIKKQLKVVGNQLTKTRKNAATELQEKIEKSLSELNMEKSKFCVRVDEFDEFFENGMNKVEFLISTNPGEPLKPLVKIASGGELSRVMLAIKSILADTDEVGTLIFDEIDTGVSGKAALKIAKKLTEIGKSKQVICITHLPQLTAAADTHYLILKNTDGSLASTSLTELDEKGRETELARIIDGGDVSELALEHAREMLKNAKISRSENF
jgi:DNA repair protein RecN (Recombination protein N)